MTRYFAIFLLAGANAAALAQGPDGPFHVVETDKSFATLAQAVSAIGAGEGTIEIAPGTYRQCAVQSAGRITYRAVMPGAAIFDGEACEGKAGLVLRGRAARVDGVVFQNYAVPDGNGAGIRLERGDLSVENSYFRNSEEGILANSDERATIGVDRSTFTGLGRCDRGLDCAHSIYVGHYALLTMTRNRFEAGTGGHYLKSRARKVMITNNSFDDSAGKQTNYMIDLPAGTVGRITGNMMVQGRDKDNYSAFIALGAEGGEQPSDGLAIEGNVARFVPGLARRSAFLADWTGARVALGENSLAPGVARYEKR